MSFTVNDVQDLTLILALHPEWLAEVRRLVLTQELLTLPEVQKRQADHVARLRRAGYPVLAVTAS